MSSPDDHLVALALECLRLARPMPVTDHHPEVTKEPTHDAETFTQGRQGSRRRRIAKDHDERRRHDPTG